MVMQNMPRPSLSFGEMQLSAAETRGIRRR
jgi:hypothetical protein